MKITKRVTAVVLSLVMILQMLLSNLGSVIVYADELDIQYTSIPVNISWNGDAEEDRPESVIVKLLQNGAEYSSLEVKLENDWKYEFTDVPVYDSDGNAYEYSVVEEDVEKYIESYVTGNKNGLAVAFNENSSSVNEVYGAISIYYELDGKTYSLGTWAAKELAGEVVEIPSKDFYLYWYGYYNFLNYYGFSIDYIIEKEVSVPIGVSESILPSADIVSTSGVKYPETLHPYTSYVSTLWKYEGLGGTGYDVINISNANDISGTINWVGDTDELRPDSVTIKLLQNGSEFKTLEVLESDGWKYEFSDIPVYNEDNMTAYEYSVVAEADGYVVSCDGFDISNIYNSVDINIETHWIDGSKSEEDRPQSITYNLVLRTYLYDENGSLTGEYTDEVVDSVNTDSSKNWVASFTDVTRCDDNGNDLTYLITVSNSDGYQMTGSNVNFLDEGNILTVPAVLTSENRDVTGLKSWNGDSEEDRPESITITLYQNGSKYATTTTSAEEEWVYSFENVPEFDENGNKYEYYIEETPVEGYVATYYAEGDGVEITFSDELSNVSVDSTLSVYYKLGDESICVAEFSSLVEASGVKVVVPSIEFYIVTSAEIEVPFNYELISVEESDAMGIVENVSSVELGGIEISKLNGVEGTYSPVNATSEDTSNVYGYGIITSSDEPSSGLMQVANSALTVDVNVSVVWVGDTESDRPDSITAKLLYNSYEMASVALNADNNWENTATCVYRASIYLEEIVVDGYTTVISGDINSGFVITNTLEEKEIEMTTVSGSLTWEGDTEEDRPESVTVKILQNDSEYGTVEVTADNGWAYSFEEPKYDSDGAEYEYTIDVEAVENYFITTNGYDIISTYNLKTISGIISWLGYLADNVPDSVTVIVLRDGEEYTSVEVTLDDGWKYSFTLPMTGGDGAEYEYTLETQVDGFTTTYDGYDINLTSDVETVTVSGTKTWIGDTESDRPEYITVRLLRNGVIYTSMNVSAEDNWEYTFSNIPKYDSDKNEYVYTVEEETIDGYAPAYNGHDIINTFDNKIEISGSKIWIGDKESDRPESITIFLLQNGKEYKSVTVTDSDNWEYNFGYVPKYDADTNEYVYTLKEDEVEGYTASYILNAYDNYNVINTYNNLTTISGKKIWVDESENDRPDSITVILLRNGVEYNYAKVTSENGWAYEFNDVIKYDDEMNEYVYTIEEETVAGYKTSYNGYDIINTRITFPLEFTKKDFLSDTVLSDVKFDIYELVCSNVNSEHNHLKPGNSTCWSHVKEMTSNTNGKVEINAVKSMTTYGITEIVPTGYALPDSLYWQVMINDNGVVTWKTVWEDTELADFMKDYEWTGYNPDVVNDNDTFIIYNMPSLRHVDVTKRIKVADTNFVNGKPVFLFKLEGIAADGSSKTYYKHVEFNKNWSEYNMDEDGYVFLTVTFEGLLAGEYILSEDEVSRYVTEYITDVTNGTINGETVVFNLTNNTSGSATYSNTVYENQWFSHNDMVVNCMNENNNEKPSPISLQVISNIEKQTVDLIDRNELEVIVYYEDGTSRVLNNDEYTIDPEELNTSMNGEYTFTAEYVEDYISVKDNFIIDIELPTRFDASVSVSEDGSKYKVAMKISSSDVEKKRNEVILMTDASSSIKTANWEKVKAAIRTIGENVLDGQGYNVLTIMGFGISDNIVASQIETIDELDAILTSANEDMLYGRSSTNCEVGFNGVQNYIKANKEGLNKAYVIYITDGNTNMSEEPYKFYDAIYNTDWHASKLSTEDIAFSILYEYELYRIANGGEPVEATMDLFGNMLDELVEFYNNGDEESINSAVSVTGNDGSKTLLLEWFECHWKNVFEYSDLDIEKEYPVSIIEKAFVDYDNDYNCKLNSYEMADAFYYCIFSMSHNVFTDSYRVATRNGLRASKACDSLANMSEVSQVFLVGFGNTDDSWLNPNRATKTNSSGQALPYVTSKKVEYQGVANLKLIADALPNILPNILKTSYNDLTFVDYTSKWVDLLPDTIKICNNDNVIYEYNATTNKGTWYISEDETPTENEPIIIEKINGDDYPEYGDSITGNTSKDIYKITWKVRDGVLLSTDDYYLEYEVYIDMDEAGFAYDTYLPTSSNITAYYYGSNGVLYEENITCPVVSVQKNE